MNEKQRDPAQEFEDQMRAADALIESLESEVTDLRRDLERASAALRASREEVSGQGQALEDLEASEKARVTAEEEIQSLWAELNELRQRTADEQLRLRNEHIARMAALREDLEEQRHAEMAAVESEGKVSALREEFRKEKAILEERHLAEIEDLKRSSEQWEESLREGYRELEERNNTEVEKLRKDHAAEVGRLKEEHDTEVEGLRTQAEGQKIEQERAIREEMENRREEELQALRSAAASRELELQKELRTAVEDHKAEVEALRLELEQNAAAAEERRNKELREVKRLAAGREQELKQAQAARLAEEKESAERRVSTLKAQRKADYNTLKEQYTSEIKEVQSDLTARLAAEEERRRSEAADFEERLEGIRSRQESEARLYGERLEELERSRVEEKGAAEQELERRLTKEEREKTRLKDRIAEIQDALEDSETIVAELRAALQASSAAREEERWQDDDYQEEQEEAAEEEAEDEEFEGRIEELDAARVLAEERAANLEKRLREAEEEIRQRDRDLEEAREGLKRVSDPEQRLRSGISLFNTSEHTRTVSSISKALGLPRVNVGSDGGPNSSLKKPIITFVWSDMAWRRYVSDPTDGVEEPRVYLIGAGDDPTDLNRPNMEPNARMDAKGRLILGVQAR
ncbi:MAG: hypothetical protein LC751_13240 [Actinobacteria bacterium]|nr:hypothetical protein [Actinomycetota bacterium]MCA1739676.1 hypothetical protein [Actinomycetota bacterium]